MEKRSVDGLRVVFKDKSWVMFRSSGTEPKTRIYCEARDELRLSELVEIGEEPGGAAGQAHDQHALIRHGDGRDGGSCF